MQWSRGSRSHSMLQDPSEIRVYNEALVGVTGDSTCHPRDSKDSYIYYYKWLYYYNY
jgi:hypothetical protein